jgi:signal transduction histidine kinase
MGHRNVHCEPLELSAVIEAGMAPLQSPIAAKGLHLAVDLPTELPQVLADFDQLRLALYQLLDNAYRYTEAGRIVVRAFVQEEMIRVEVEDSGRGIPQELQPYVFKRFARGESTYIQDYTYYPGGVGLGLSICKQLIELQGGTIWVTSTPGQGSCFAFTLPIAQGDQAL